jgi:two-component system, NtrC family, sensor kinase
MPKSLSKKKFFGIFIPFLFSLLATRGQTNLPPAFDITSDTALSTTIPRQNWKMLEDKGGKLTLEQVLKPPVAEQFRFSDLHDSTLSGSMHTYWFCYRLRNAMSHDLEFGFGPSHDYEGGWFSSYDESAFYFYNGIAWNHIENGIYSPWNNARGLVLNHFYPLVIKPNEELIVYNRIYNTPFLWWHSNAFPIAFHSTRKMMEKADFEAAKLYLGGIHDAILFGILFFACLLNFFFYLVSKERVYLLLSLFLIDLGVGRMPEESYLVFFREWRVMWGIVYHYIFLFPDFLLAIFLIAFLQTRNHLPKWHKSLEWLIYFNLTYVLVTDSISSIFDVSNSALDILGEILNNLQRLLLLVAFMIILSRRFYPNKKTVILVFPAFAIWVIFNTMQHLYDAYGVVSFSSRFSKWLGNSWDYIETACLVWLTLAFSWALLQRFRKLQNELAHQALEKEREKSILIEQKRIELEKTVEERTSELKHSLENLQSTQSQLIQSEKMASLGELTAGIAHEIQNPLNFVNNFSEVNTELISEAKQAIDAGNPIEAKRLLSSLDDNEQKIKFHGQRADAIVKGMLLHSRENKGQKELTDINALADEYLKLSYHGLRAKEKSFQATMQTDFDTSIGRINIIPQDIGRVLLNLYNNAFYVVSEKKKQRPVGYEPTITVSTRKIANKVEIRVKDNGNGIPQKVIDKIFQPFFTTKPAGQGTGLGLSMSYDIVKAHGGEIMVETKQSEYAEFIIQLPA